MKRILSVLATIGLFAVGCDGRDPTTPMPDGLQVTPQAGIGPVVHHASLGGPDICFTKPGCHANFSLVANEYSDGTVKGEVHDERTGGPGTHVSVDCLAIYGNQAVIGGVITKSYDPTKVGGHAITAVWDNGTSANDPPDQTTLLFAPPTTDPFPDCHSVPPWLFEYYGAVFDVPQGQVKVW